jgi:hypothetical protein
MRAWTGWALRGAVCLLGLAGIAYGKVYLPDNGRTLEALARKVVLGESFPLPVLEAAIADGAPDRQSCDLGRLRSLTILRAQRADEIVTANNLERMDAAILDLGQVAERLLACSPRESFGWLMLYWSETRRNGLSEAALSALSRSYAFGPREAWVAIRRNAMAIGVLRHLPEELQQQALTEFAALLEMQFTVQLAATLAMAPSDVQARLYGVAASASESARIRFSFALRARGMPTRELGLPIQPWRPWRMD